MLYVIRDQWIAHLFNPHDQIYLKANYPVLLSDSQEHFHYIVNGQRKDDFWHDYYTTCHVV